MNYNEKYNGLSQDINWKDKSKYIIYDDNNINKINIEKTNYINQITVILKDKDLDFQVRLDKIENYKEKYGNWFFHIGWIESVEEGKIQNLTFKYSIENDWRYFSIKINEDISEDYCWWDFWLESESNTFWIDSTHWIEPSETWDFYNFVYKYFKNTDIIKLILLLSKYTDKNDGYDIYRFIDFNELELKEKVDNYNIDLEQYVNYKSHCLVYGDDSINENKIPSEWDNISNSERYLLKLLNENPENFMKYIRTDEFKNSKVPNINIYAQSLEDQYLNWDKYWILKREIWDI